jgi:translation initiation factor 1
MTRSKDPDFRLVYSTDQGEICLDCGKPRSRCSCANDKLGVVKGDGNVKVRRETKGRGGKTVTTVTGLPLTKADLATLLKDLKRVCGTGGTEKDGVLEIQGDHCEAVMGELSKRGIRSKRAGG